MPKHNSENITQLPPIKKFKKELISENKTNSCIPISENVKFIDELNLSAFTFADGNTANDLSVDMKKNCNQIEKDTTEILPSTSKIPDNPQTHSKEDKHDISFWNKINKPRETINSSVKKSIKIMEIVEGKYTKIALKIRMTYKSEVRQTSIGHVLSFHGMDDTGDIAFIIFGKQSTSQQMSDLKVNKIYVVQNFKVYKEDPDYPSGTGNPLQIRINSCTTIEETSDEKDFPQIQFSFIKLNNIKTIEENLKIDVIGILVKDYGLDTNKTGSIFRDLILTDDTKEEIKVTLWSTTAELFSCKNFSPIAIKRASVIEYNGKIKLNCLGGTLIWCNPENNEYATNLCEWFKTETAEIPGVNI